jgi:4'-phosphopantetheinyl transferase EntD
VLAAVARVEELPALHDLKRKVPATHWDRLLFSAKESVYKAWYPLAGRWLGFDDAIVTVDLPNRSFQARIVASEPMTACGLMNGFSGRWIVHDDLVLTAIVVAA